MRRPQLYLERPGGLPERERETEFYLTPAAPGRGHIAAGAAEVNL